MLIGMRNKKDHIKNVKIWRNLYQKTYILYLNRQTDVNNIDTEQWYQANILFGKGVLNI